MSVAREIHAIMLLLSVSHVLGMTKKLHKVVFVLGPPGSGKGTQCANIQKVYNLFFSSFEEH